MTIHSLYIFSKNGTCLYYREWYRPRSTLAAMPDEDRKLMFGLLLSLKMLMNKLSPTGEIGAEAKSTPGTASLPGALPPAGPEQGITRYTCSHYVLHNLETPTGYRFAITSDAAAGDLRAALWHIYSELFVGFALKNPLYVTGTPIKSAMFADQVDAFLKALPAFSAKA